jgi:ribosomal-protein-alanine N-acetyltransferase
VAISRQSSNDVSGQSRALTIRPATTRDLPAIFEIERLAFDHPWSLDSFVRELSLAFSLTLAAFTGPPTRQMLSGYLCRWLVADECHILNVAVHPRYRRQGIAERLMAEVIAEATAKKASVATLEVRRTNLSARGLYRKFKFEERRLRKNYYGPGEDAIVMELKL